MRLAEMTGGVRCASLLLVCAGGLAAASASVGRVAHGYAVTATTTGDGALRARDEMRPCAWTSPGGHAFDLSALVRRGADEDYSVHIPHSNFAMLINLCANTLRVPRRCAGLSSARASVGFQWDTSNGNSCWELGSLETATWDLLDESDPQKGVDIMFTGGTPCATGARMVHFHMVCARNVGDEGPSFAWEAPTCSYHVVWPTIHACPRASGWSWTSWLGFAIAAMAAGAFGAAWRRARDTGEDFKGALFGESARLARACADAAVEATGRVAEMGRGLGGGEGPRPSRRTFGGEAAGPSRADPPHPAATKMKPYRDDGSDEDEDQGGDEFVERGGATTPDAAQEDPFLDGGDELAPMPLGDSI